MPIWNGGLQMLLVSLSIILCAVSVLASMGTKICMSKDWVVVISGCDKEKLASTVFNTVFACVEHLNVFFSFECMDA